MATKSSSVKKPIKSKGEKQSSQQSVVRDPIISRIREFAWAGQHPRAIELASQTLNMSGLKNRTSPKANSTSPQKTRRR
jgi:hypothetical protein